MQNPMVRYAARAGEAWGMDPVVILQETDDFKAGVRLAGWMVLVADSKRNAEQQK